MVPLVQIPPSPILQRHLTALSPWVSVAARDLAGPGGRIDTYHGLIIADYVTVLAVTATGLVPLVRQFRPAVEQITLELPGGLAEPGESAAVTAERELAEECGLALSQALVPLGRLETDYGRLNNSIWGFFAAGVLPVSGWQPEPTVETLAWPIATLKDAVREGGFTHAPHVALIGLAVLKGLI